MMNERLELLMNDVQMSTKVKIETRTSIRSMMKMEMKMTMKMDVLSILEPTTNSGPNLDYTRGLSPWRT